ncbi:MAG: MarR family transcriptional regulator [Xanthobacteraceae bacterium]|jgi:DNA-binding MarR family transcriptional regulator|nr:MarR family transcriptional regulator [Xanthobacteraceae bacterium]
MKQESLSRSAEAEAASPRKNAANENVDFGPLANWVGFHLRLAQTASFQAFVQEARSVDLSPGRFATLLLIGRNPGISQTALAAANGRDKSTLTPILEDLERRGFIVREKMKTDRRSYQLTLTDAGKKMLDQLTVCAKRHDDNLDRIIGPKDRAKFLKILQKIATEIGRGE